MILECRRALITGVAVGILVVLSATGVVCVLGWVDAVMAVNTRGQL